MSYLKHDNIIFLASALKTCPPLGDEMALTQDQIADLILKVNRLTEKTHALKLTFTPTSHTCAATNDVYVNINELLDNLNTLSDTLHHAFDLLETEYFSPR
ncbi:MAG: hypothetical protein B7Z15_03730 [Rhizobiales bacterium 32-66-8]|nr:MAG: hypothetical protein B7Z15_03730 [Rhizobiales bacterium 32-66-8]